MGELILEGVDYLEGQRDLRSRLILGMTRVAMWLIGFINPLTKSP